MHIWDGVTPVEEIVETLCDLVRAGKIRYYALSDMAVMLWSPLAGGFLSGKYKRDKAISTSA